MLSMERNTGIRILGLAWHSKSLMQVILFSTGMRNITLIIRRSKYLLDRYPFFELAFYERKPDP